jgi:hypothetical protein
VNYYSFEEIREQVDCQKLASALSIELRGDRGQAFWRQGDGWNVQYNEKTVHDYAEDKTYSAIDFVALVHTNGDVDQAQDWLGRHLNLIPAIDFSAAKVVGNSKYDDLKGEGWEEVTRYHYVTAEGAPVLDVVRMQRDGRKTFLQWDAQRQHWGTRDIDQVPLYRAPAVAQAQAVIVCEGEKDADRLAGLGWGCAVTSCSGGARKWQDHHTEAVRGKHVCLLQDNDDAGRAHVLVVAKSILPVVASLRIVAPCSKAKGDACDYLDQGGDPARLLARIQAADPVTEISDREQDVANAKAANQEPFTNYEEEWVGKKKHLAPRQLPEMVADIHTRFLGFPRRCGEQLWDHDRDTGDIHYLGRSATLQAWIAMKSGQNCIMQRMPGFAGMADVYEALLANAPRVEAISSVPDYPRRSDVYYHHDPLPPPTADWSALEGLVDFFAPASEEDKIMLRAFIMAPLWWRPGVPRPLWIIDSDARGSGKTTLVNTVACLYGEPALVIHRKTLSQGMPELMKRLISGSGRQARIALFDNVSGTFRSEELAHLVTTPYITGRAPYGVNEEQRPNNLTWVITANSAAIDDDLAVRGYFVALRRVSEYSADWDRRLQDYVTEHRMQILADILDRIQIHKKFDVSLSTRFGSFEAEVVQAACSSANEYLDVAKAQMEQRSRANVDSEHGAEVADEIRYQLRQLDIPVSACVFLRGQVMRKWLQPKFPHVRSMDGFVRGLVRDGHVPEIDQKLEIWPHNGQDRRRGYLWVGDGGSKKPVWAVYLEGQESKKISAVL